VRMKPPEVIPGRRMRRQILRGDTEFLCPRVSDRGRVHRCTLQAVRHSLDLVVTRRLAPEAQHLRNEFSRASDGIFRSLVGNSVYIRQERGIQLERMWVVTSLAIKVIHELDDSSDIQALRTEVEFVSVTAPSSGEPSTPGVSKRTTPPLRLPVSPNAFCSRWYGGLPITTVKRLRVLSSAAASPSTEIGSAIGANWPWVA